MIGSAADGCLINITTISSNITFTVNRLNNKSLLSFYNITGLAPDDYIIDCYDIVDGTAESVSFFQTSKTISNESIGINVLQN